MVVMKFVKLEYLAKELLFEIYSFPFEEFQVEFEIDFKHLNRIFDV